MLGRDRLWHQHIRANFVAEENRYASKRLRLLELGAPITVARKLPEPCVQVPASCVDVFYLGRNIVVAFLKELVEKAQQNPAANALRSRR